MREIHHSQPDATSFRPEQARGEWAIALLLFVLSALYLWPFHDVTILFVDEGIVLQGAERILRGQVPYRDFFSFYTPGTYYWLAARLRLFGDTFLVARAMLLLYGGLFSARIYFLARRVCERGTAILTTYLFLVIGLPNKFIVAHNWDSSVLACLALYCGVRLVEGGKWGWALATGTLAALTCLFEQSKGAGLVLGLGLGLFVVGSCSREGREVFRRRNLAALAAGFVWPWALTVSYFGMQHCLTQMVADWFWPVFHYAGANRLPYGYVNIPHANWEDLFGSASWGGRLAFVFLTAPCFILPALPFVAAALLIHAGRRLWKTKSGGSAAHYVVLVSAVALGLTLSVVVTGRTDYDHFVYISPPLLLILGLVLGGQLVRSNLLDRVRPLLATFFLIVFTALGMLFYLREPLGAHDRLETRRGPVRTPARDEVIPYLQAHTTTSQMILIYPYQPIYYYLTATHSPTQFDYLQIGMHSPEQFARAVADVAADPPTMVIWNLSFNTQTIIDGWPATPLGAMAKDPLRDYIVAHYCPCTTLGSIGFRHLAMVRRDLPCEAGAAGRSP